MADGLVKIGSKRILPAPRSTLEAFLSGGGGGGGGDGGYMPPSGPSLSGVELPNGEGNIGYSGIGSESDLPITTRTFYSDTVLSEADEDTISVDDDNYIEASNMFWPVCAGHRVEYDVSAYVPARVAIIAAGYGYEDNGPTYKFWAGAWSYEHSIYNMWGSHVATEKHEVGGQTKLAGEFISAGDVVSQLMQGQPWANGAAATTRTLTYYACLEVYE